MLKGTDSKGTQLGNIDFIEAEWDRKWSATGEFMAYLPLAEYMRLEGLGVKYIENVGRPERGIIQKIEYSKKNSGAFVTVSGYFIENLLDFCAYRRTAVISASTAAGVKSGIASYLAKASAGIAAGGVTYKPVSSLMVDAGSVFPASMDVSIDNGTQAGEGVYQALSGTGYSMRASIASYPQSGADAVGVSVKFISGRERTEGDDAIYFGKAYNNVSNISYILDESAERCLYEVIQEVDSQHYGSFSAAYFPVKFSETVDGEAHYYVGCTYVYGGNRPGGLGDVYPKKILETSISSEEADLTVTTAANQSKIANLMKKKAQLDMLDNYKVETISADVIQERYHYLSDYDIGDVCIVQIDDIGQQYAARIEEIQETHKSNRVDVKLILGTPTKQKYRK